VLPYRDSLGNRISLCLLEISVESVHGGDWSKPAVHARLTCLLLCQAQANEDSDRREVKREDDDYDDNVWSDSSIPMPKPSAVDEARWPSTLVAYLQASRSGVVDTLPSLPNETLEVQSLKRSLRVTLLSSQVLEAGGFDELSMHNRVDLMCLLCDDACATAGIHQQLNQVLLRMLRCR